MRNIEIQEMWSINGMIQHIGVDTGPACQVLMRNNYFNRSYNYVKLNNSTIIE